MRLSMTVENLAAFYEDPHHRMAVAGTIAMRFPGEPARTEYPQHPVEGIFELFTPRRKPYGIPNEKSHDRRRKAQQWRAGYETEEGEPPQERFMTYRFAIKDEPGFFVWGYKRIREHPAIDAWRDTSSLFVTLVGSRRDGRPGRSVARGAGVVHVDLPSFLFRQMPSITVGYAGGGPEGEFVPATDPAATVWAIAKFAAFFFGSLQRIYAPDLTNIVASAFRGDTSNLRYEPSRLGRS
jgi:hypothetical protein